MMDYQGYWLGFVLLFGMLPAVFGAGGGLVWAWRAGRRGGQIGVRRAHTSRADWSSGIDW